MTAPTLSQIAADVRRLAPDALRHTVTVPTRVDDFYRDEDEDYLSFGADAGPEAALKDRLALGMAMVLACGDIERLSYGWRIEVGVRSYSVRCDSDHGGDWLLSLHAAFCEARKEPAP